MSTPTATSISLYPREGIAPTMLGFALGLGILVFFFCLALVIGQTTTFESGYPSPHQ